MANETELEKIDLDKFIKETEEYKEVISLIEKVKSEEELNKVLLNEYKKFGFSLLMHFPKKAPMSSNNEITFAWSTFLPPEIKFSNLLW